MHIIILNLPADNCVSLKDSDFSIYVNVVVEEMFTMWKVFFIFMYILFDLRNIWDLRALKKKHVHSDISICIHISRLDNVTYI